MKPKNFQPVRKVNNKSSKLYPHSKGSFFSFKMNKEIEYESLSECYFFFFLDLNPKVKKYFPQPMKINIPVKNHEQDFSVWEHVPDVLVYWTSLDKKPTIYQIKYEIDQNDSKQKIANKYCEKYAQKNNYEYRVIEIISVDKTVMKNLKFLHSHLKERSYFKEIIPSILELFAKHTSLTVEEVCEKLNHKYRDLFILPTVYYLLANNLLGTNINVELGLHSVLSKEKYEIKLEKGLALEE
ncbi:hypothetical protein B4U37_19640 [Sutcliffiella horikoshii]|uniref:TnsA endonuclease C-terminal domain-containing protein n=1 Tax=Sutcliffiella horikoshii TaxID=79883 RepID=A0ABM6KNS9_9BACI|nr:TnsA endonuclease C-terminal domain-containing protein [Sutcliffiella horikoshii]ART78114.1 hypothetical protein B4U37_19640 [Sutcliffiella horikoshii]